MKKMPFTGYTAISIQYDNTVVDYPFYETTSDRGSLIEVMKNEEIILNETIISEEDTLTEEDDQSS